MPISILAHFSGLASDRAVIDTALSLARSQGGRVLAMYSQIEVVDAASVLQVGLPSPQIPMADTLARIGAEERERSRHAKTAFDDAIRRHGVTGTEDACDGTLVTASWKEAGSFFNEGLPEARYHDVTVMGRDSELPMDRIKAILMESGRPLVLAPPKSASILGRTVAVAWNGSAEAARAVTAAAPLLAGAERIFVIAALPKDSATDKAPDTSSAEHLAATLRAKHLKAEVKTAASATASDSEIVKNCAYECDADLLVMGAYGHSRLREYVLGGVTEDILRDCAIPAFLFK